VGDLPVLPDDPLSDPPTDALPDTSGSNDSSGTNGGPKSNGLTDQLQDTTGDILGGGGGSDPPKSGGGGGKNTGVGGLLAPITEPVGELLDGVLNAP
jgi:hypothetical protein